MLSGYTNKGDSSDDNVFKGIPGATVGAGDCKPKPSSKYHLQYSLFAQAISTRVSRQSTLPCFPRQNAAPRLVCLEGSASLICQTYDAALCLALLV